MPLFFLTPFFFFFFFFHVWTWILAFQVGVNLWLFFWIFTFCFFSGSSHMLIWQTEGWISFVQCEFFWLITVMRMYRESWREYCPEGVIRPWIVSTQTTFHWRILLGSFHFSSKRLDKIDSGIGSGLFILIYICKWSFSVSYCLFLCLVAQIYACDVRTQPQLSLIGLIKSN